MSKTTVPTERYSFPCLTEDEWETVRRIAHKRVKRRVDDWNLHSPSGFHLNHMVTEDAVTNGILYLVQNDHWWRERWLTQLPAHDWPVARQDFIVKHVAGQVASRAVMLAKRVEYDRWGCLPTIPFDEDERQEGEDGERKSRRSPVPLGPSTEDVVLRELDHRELWAIVYRLTDAQQTTLLAHAVDGESLACIARREGVSASAVHERLRSALKRLRATAQVDGQ